MKEFRRGISKIWRSGLDVKEQVIDLLILNKLPKEFESFIWIIIQDSSSFKVGDIIKKVGEYCIQFRLNKAGKVAMVGQQQQLPKRTVNCYNCDSVGNSEKECKKPCTNSKYAPTLGNIGETEPINISFIAMKEEEPEELIQDKGIRFYNPITSEMKIFGDHGRKVSTVRKKLIRQ